MAIPKFKPTKWKVKMCRSCMMVDRWGQCRSPSHTIIETENIPFFVPDMQIIYVSYWTRLVSKELGGVKFEMSPSNLEKVIMNVGIESGGAIKDQWWMYCKVGSSCSLKIVLEK